MADFLSNILRKYPNSPMDPSTGQEEDFANTLLAEAAAAPVSTLDPDTAAKRQLYNKNLLDQAQSANLSRMGGGAMMDEIGTDQIDPTPALFNKEKDPTNFDPELWASTEKQFTDEKASAEKRKKEDIAEAQRLAEKVNKARMGAGMDPLNAPSRPLTETDMKSIHGDDIPRAPEDKLTTKEEIDAELTPIPGQNVDENEEDLSLSNLPRMKNTAPASTDYMKALIEAQRQSQNMAGLQMIGKGAERIGSALARVPHDKDYLNEMSPMINQPVTNVLNQQRVGALGLDEQLKRRDIALKQDEDDPDSKASQIAREILVEAKINLNTKGMSATEIQARFPMIKSLIEARLNREAKSAYQDIKKAGDKEKSDDKLTVKLADAFEKSLNPDTQRNTNLAKLQARVYGADNLLTLAKDSNGNINNLPAPQMEELSLGLAKMLSPGTGGTSRGQVEALVPKSAIGSSQKLKSWLMNEPAGANQQKFIHLMVDTIERERAMSVKQVAENQKRSLETGNARRYKALDPEGYDLYINKYNLQDENFDKKGNYIGPGTELLNQRNDGKTAPKGMVKIRRKSDGAVKTLSAQDATEYLQDPKFELVK